MGHREYPVLPDTRMRKGGMFNMKRTKKFLSLTLAAALAAGMSLPALAAEETAPVFTDVASDAWYAPAVTYVAEKGIMNGTGGDAYYYSRALFPVITLNSSLIEGDASTGFSVK